MPYADRWIALGNRRLGALVEPLDDEETRWRWTCWAGWSRHERGETDDKVSALHAVEHFLDSLPG